jgi:hypothetical protein
MDARIKQLPDDAPTAHSGFRLRFSLFALLALITAVSLLLGWYVQPQRVVATALFEVRSQPDELVAYRLAAADSNDREYEILKNTQLALLDSNYILEAALRNPKISGLGLWTAKSDPVSWLRDHLDVGFRQGSEILAIKLHGTQVQGPDLVAIVDAVAQAYKDEVSARDARVKLGTRDLLARNLESLNSEIRRKTEEFVQIAREAGNAADGPGQILQQLSMKRLDRVETELMRLEAELVGTNGDRKPVEQRIGQLREQQTELEKKLTAQAETSPDLEMRRDELTRLRKIADELTGNLELLDMAASRRSRIQQLQAAVISEE